MLLDKMLGVINCKMKGIVRSAEFTGETIQINIQDSSGMQLDAAGLCYHVMHMQH